MKVVNPQHMIYMFLKVFRCLILLELTVILPVVGPSSCNTSPFPHRLIIFCPYPMHLVYTYCYISPYLNYYNTYLFCPACVTKKIIAVAIIIKNTNGIVQPLVISYIEPITIGPQAANIYPMDCAIPDKSAASFASFARIERNVSAIAKLELEAIPINPTETKIITMDE